MKQTKQVLAIILLSLVTFAFNYKKPEMVERKQLFDFDWKFYLGDSPANSAADYDDSSWRTLDLPHDWSIEGKPEKTNPSQGDGGFFPMGTGWYRKAFDVPSNWKDKKIAIYFEGVYMNSEVFINGKSVGIQPYGYTSFRYDLTPYLEFGKKNTIAVRVDNSQQKNCRWYSGSGIYRHVWLMVTDQVHLNDWGVAITTPEVTDKKATVKVSTTVSNETALPQNVTLCTQLTDKKGKKAGTADLVVALQPNEKKEVVQTIEVKNPILWTPETPNLYQAKFEITQGKNKIDALNKTFGIRTISFTAEKGFLLNGKKTIINGGCVHHDNGSLGAAAYDRAEVRKVELLKKGGYNLVRTSHNPPTEAFLDACDRLGLLVIDEAFDGWRTEKTPHDYSKYFDKWWKHDIESMVLRDRNHPSIVLWSIGNEIIERKEPQAVETAKMLSNAVKAIDPTRPITSAMTTWDNDWAIFDPLMAAHDVAGYNYQLHHAEEDHKRAPSRIILQTESYPKDAFYCWSMAQKHDYIIGDVVWTALDYLGESGIGRYFYPGEPKGEHWESNLFPWHGAYCGDIDLLGWRKPISHYRSMLYNDNEKLYMAVRQPNPDNGEISLTWWAVWPTWESWTWPGHEGKNIDVEVYSKYPKVRLYLNDKLVGEKATTINEEFKATFKLPYEKGTLKAVGVKEDNSEAESVLLKTAEKAAKIKLTADHSEIKADGQDLSYVIVDITDNQGIIDPNATNKLKFTVTGPGVIVAVDNAYLKDTDSYVADTRNAWNGRAMVVIKSTKKEGDIKVEVSSEGLSTGVINIKTSKKK